MRFNDGKLDASGRFLVGTMGDLERVENGGFLYSVENGRSRELISGITVSNGLGFSTDNKTLYFIDTPTKNVMAYDYDLKTGNISNPRMAIKINGDAAPDGMCVGTDDTLWVAEWGGGRVGGWNPKTGELIHAINLPCRNVTSCCLGGDDMKDLFITTAKCEGFYEPMAGSLFVYHLGD